MALAAALVGLLLGGARCLVRNAQAQAGRRRDARNAEAVAALLGQCEEALKAGDAARAAVALEAAQKRLAEGGAQEQAQRLGRLDADLDLLRELDAVDQFHWTPVGNRFADPAVVGKRTRAALTRFGADPDAAPDEAAARVSTSVVRERIVTALDRLLRQEKTAGVRVVPGRWMPTPYRDAVRCDPRQRRGEDCGTGGTEGHPGATAGVRCLPVCLSDIQWSGGDGCWSGGEPPAGDLCLLMTLALPPGRPEGRR